jgi:hypothetical protein
MTAEDRRPTQGGYGQHGEDVTNAAAAAASGASMEQVEAAREEARERRLADHAEALARDALPEARAGAIEDLDVESGFRLLRLAEIDARLDELREQGHGPDDEPPSEQAR